MRDFWFTGEMQNVPPQPMLSPAERRLHRIAMIDPAYKPLTDAVKPYLAELIAATASVFEAAAGGGDVFAAIQTKEPHIAKAIRSFAEASGIDAEKVTRVLFHLSTTGTLS